MYKKIIIIISLVLIISIIFQNKSNKLPLNKIFDPMKNGYDFIEAIQILFHENKLLKYKKELPKHLKPRNDIPIQNKYILIKNNFDISDYHFVLYYLDTNKFKVIIRRLDDYEIIRSFKLKLYNIDNDNYEIFKFKPNKDNVIEKILNTKINLEKTNLDIKQKIPKIIIQTSKSRNTTLAEYNAVMTFIELNPEYEYMHFDDGDCINYLNKYENIIDAYNKLVPTAYKADLFRACILNDQGGCYFDIKQVNRTPIREFILDQDIILCQETYKTGFYNAVMLVKPNYFIINNYINAIIDNINNKYYGTCPLCPTGPCLLYEVAHNNVKPELINKTNMFIMEIYKFRYKGIIYSNKINKILSNITYLGYYKVFNSNSYASKWHLNAVYV